MDSVNYISIHITNLNKTRQLSRTYWTVFTGNTSQKVTFPAWAGRHHIRCRPGSSWAPMDCFISRWRGPIWPTIPPPTPGHTGSFISGPKSRAAYDSDTTYNFGEIVFSTAQVAYMSVTGGNDNAPSTGTGWVAQTGATLAPIFIPWPAGTGPATQLDTTSSVFMLPYGYLREAPQDPRAGDTSDPGLPIQRLRALDWLLEGSYIISQDPGPLMLRFGADIKPKCP
jgi:hypothetical protein